MDPDERAAREVRRARYWRHVQTVIGCVLYMNCLTTVVVLVAARRRYTQYHAERVAFRHRRTTVTRLRRRWRLHIRPLLDDGTFSMKFRMSKASFDNLHGMLRGRLEKTPRLRGITRNGDIPTEMALAAALRWLAGGSVHEVMELVGIARSTAYYLITDVLEAITSCRRLAIKWPRTAAARRAAARRFRKKSACRVIKKCIGAVDGIVIRIRKPSTKEHLCPDRFFSGHKKVVGLNMQAICSADYQFIAVCVNLPASMNDRTAWREAGFHTLTNALPGRYFVIGDAAYPSTNKVLVPWPGTQLSATKDAYNYFQSSSRMCIEQTFGIMVKTWGVLWRPLAVPLRNAPMVLHAIVRLHNFIRRERDVAPSATGHPQVNTNGSLADESWSPPPVGGVGAQATSATRNLVIADIEMRGLRRPAHNVTRNNTNA